MGLLSLNTLRSRESRYSKLPLYNQEPKSDRQVESGADDSSEDYEDSGDVTDYSTSSPSPQNSRRPISPAPAPGIMLSKRPLASPRHPARRYIYRLPNKVVRYLCLGMIMTIVLFMWSLVRASQIDNKRLLEGKLDKQQIVVPYTWESFHFLTRYYGGVRRLLPLAQNFAEYPRLGDEEPYEAAVTPSAPSPAAKRAVEDEALGANEAKIPPSKAFTDYSNSALSGLKEQIQECFVDDQNTVRIPSIRYFEGRPNGFPLNILGSYELLSLPEDICYERHGRYGPYGYGYSVRSGGLGVGENGDREGSDAVWETTPRVDWSSVNWADTQRRCFEANARRYKPMASRNAPPRGYYIAGYPTYNASLEVQDQGMPAVAEAEKRDVPTITPVDISAINFLVGDLPRTAVVIRCWDEYVWKEEDIMNLRALISELSLASGARYDVHLLVQVKNDARDPVWADDEVYRRVIREHIPAEFQGLATLWTETQMLSLYQGLYDLFTRGPNLPVHGSYRGLQMAMQYFAYNHPEYDYFWQWEMDIRYIGHYYDLFTKLEVWAQQQPRKGLWERNARFYIPAVHGSWEDFRQMARVQTEDGTVGADNIWQHVPGTDRDKEPGQLRRGDRTVWGPQRPVDVKDWFETESDPVPPTTYERDKYAWGEGEEADLITLNPIFDPEGTTWGLADDITGYEEADGIGKPPRRAQIITASRMSRRLLLTMHRETAFKKHHAFPEMWPATVALHHGFKAVFAPHPLFIDREWPTEYLGRVFNGGRNGASGGSRTSVFGDREHNMRGLSWFYNSGFAPNLYRRWLGLRVNNDGGEEFELTADLSKNDSSVSQMRGGEGRMCLPPMLVHPVKGVELPVETAPEGVGSAVVPESDPAA